MHVKAASKQIAFTRFYQLKVLLVMFSGADVHWLSHISSECSLKTLMIPLSNFRSAIKHQSVPPIGTVQTVTDKESWRLKK